MGDRSGFNVRKEEEMKSELIEDIVEMFTEAPHAQVEFKDENGVMHQGWAIAKPLNYDKEYVSEEDRKAMAQEVLEGRAIAVHFTEDEIAAGEVPALYRRWQEKEREKKDKEEKNA